MTYCFTGYPLSGKTTLARALADRLKVGIFSSGDFARAHGMGLEPSIKSMDLSLRLDSEITAAAVRAAVDGDVLDGFPRSVSQIESLRREGVLFTVVFVMENPLEIYERINERAAKEGRPEDAPDVVMGRLYRSMDFKRELDLLLSPGEMVAFWSSSGIDALVGRLKI